MSNNIELTSLTCNDNQLSELDVYKNTVLTALNCKNNEIKILDLSNNAELTELWGNDNKLKYLNLKNGKNHLLEIMHVWSNYDLFCIQVDDADNIPSTWEKDSTANFSENCNTYFKDIVNIPYPEFKKYLVNNVLINTSRDSEIQVGEAKSFEGTIAIAIFSNI